jgi:hypothetical protein
MACFCEHGNIVVLSVPLTENSMTMIISFWRKTLLLEVSKPAILSGP